jgi:pimeloyl-ACP methyl ester carboxylesterase/DNA-binding CsgD family transcriptional regulator
MAAEIRYARTSDGVNIAYFAVGSGPLLINLPAPPFGNVELSWRIDEFREQFEAAARFLTFAQYDPRGFGMSDRDVSEFSLQAMVRDIEAVVDALGHDRLAIATWDQCAMPVLAYAAVHPERVIALVLREGFGRGAAGADGALGLDLARDHWDLFVRSMADRTINLVSVSGLAQMHDLMRRTATPETFIRYARSWLKWDVFDVLDRVTVPVLVINDSGTHEDASRALAAALPRGSLVVNRISRGVRSPSEDAFREFLASAFAGEAPNAVDAAVDVGETADPGLTPREVEILRLVVDGKSGKEIAMALVLSPRTVERLIATIYRQTDTHGRAPLAGCALRQKLV